MIKSGEINVVLADDNHTIRACIRTLLRREPQIRLVGEASDGTEAIALIRRFHPQIALLDIEMPVLDGIEAAQILKSSHPEVHLIFLSAYDDQYFIQTVQEAGCSGYIVKDQAPITLIPTIREISRRAAASPQ